MRRFPEDSELWLGFPGASEFFRCELPEAGGVDHTAHARARGKTRRSHARSDTGKQHDETSAQRRRTRVCKSERDSISGSSQRRARRRRALQATLHRSARRARCTASISRVLARSRFFDGMIFFSGANRKGRACRRAAPRGGSAGSRRDARSAPSDLRPRAVPASPRAAGRASGRAR
jgi:hypothetical protein